MTRKYNNQRHHTNPWDREEETQNTDSYISSSAGRLLNQEEHHSRET